MSALRVPAAALLAASARNAARSPLRPHHRQIYETLAHGAPSLAGGDVWVLEAMLRLNALSESQQTKLNALSAKVELGR